MITVLVRTSAASWEKVVLVSGAEASVQRCTQARWCWGSARMRDENTELRMRLAAHSKIRSESGRWGLRVAYIRHEGSGGEESRMRAKHLGRAQQVQRRAGALNRSARALQRRL